MKYLHISLTKYVEDLHEENYKTLMKEVKQNQNKLRVILCSWIGRLSIVKMPVLLYLINRFNESQSKCE